MNILEIKNNLVKINYDVNDNLALADFVIIEDTNNPYVAQVMNLKSDSSGNYAIIKLLFTFNDEGILKNYNGTIPSINATVSSLPSNELLDIIPADNPIFIGMLAQKNIPLKLDKSILENNLLICSDKLTNTSQLITNIIKQIDEKAVIIDTDGQFEFDEKIVAGKDFKLPLNSETINFIYENDLDDVDPINKAVIQDIFLEVQGYIKTLPENFLPFDTFVNVIDSQYKETKIPELALLKNKLLRYKELNIFAQDLKDVLSLSIAVEQNITPVIDLSAMPPHLQKEITKYTYTVLNNINDTIYVFAKTNNSVATKKLLKRFIEKDNTYTTIICPHEFKYIEEVKEVSQNIIFFTPNSVTHNFGSYNTYLNKLNADEFVIYGAHTQNIPLIVELVAIPEENNTEETEENNSAELLDYSDNVEDDSAEKSTINSENYEIIEDVTENSMPEEASLTENPDQNLDTIEEVEIIEEPEEQTNEINEVEITEEPEVQQEEPPVIEDNQIIEEPEEQINEVDEVEITEEPEIQQEEISAIEDNSIIEENEDNSSNNDVFSNEANIENILEDYDDGTTIIETLDETSENSSDDIENQDSSIEQVVKDVDKAFYEKIPAEDEDFPEIDSSDITDDSLTDDDLNLIEDLAEDNIELAGDENYELPPEEVKEEAPVVPIYPADDIEESENIQSFEPGDKVSTAKYGEGVVEKMIKYGNKMLCSIDFPSIGRRLLDPSMTEITKLGS